MGCRGWGGSMKLTQGCKRASLAEKQERTTPAVPPHCRLVEEFMLLANMAVARKIHCTFPERALLRRHPPPQTKMLNDLVEFCDQMGLPMDFSSAGALNVSAGSTGAGEALLREGGRRPGSWAQQPLHPTRVRYPLARPHPHPKGEGRAWGQSLQLTGPGRESPQGSAVGRGPVARDGPDSDPEASVGAGIIGSQRLFFTGRGIRCSPPGTERHGAQESMASVRTAQEGDCPHLCPRPGLNQPAQASQLDMEGLTSSQDPRGRPSVGHSHPWPSEQGWTPRLTFPPQGQMISG